MSLPRAHPCRRWIVTLVLTLASAMGACIAGSGALVIVMLWLGPETRGRHFHATE